MRVHRSGRPVVLLGLLPVILMLACNGGTRSDSVTPGGPSSGASGAMTGGGMSGMGGMGGGMSMAVGSEFDYLAQMIPHHEEAITTARVLEAGTARPEMRRFARAIIESQSAEIRQMRAWLAEWYPGRDAAVPYASMMRDLSTLRGDALDQAFLTDMIPHHMMAVMMSQQYLMASYARHPQTLPFAAAIRDMQREEIQSMQGWLRTWFVASGMPD